MQIFSATTLPPGGNHTDSGLPVNKVATSNKTQHRLQPYEVVADVAILCIST